MPQKPFGKPLERPVQEFEVPPELIKKMFEDGTPLPGNRCKAKKCSGSVVREATGYFRGTIYYDLPHCELCKRVYLYACDAPKTGAQEFMDSLRQPMNF